MTEFPPFLSDDQPHDPDRSRNQIAGVIQLLGQPQRRILDLGCGNGRVLLPLAEAGHDVIGLDSNQAAVELCERALISRSIHARVRCCDFTKIAQWPEGCFDAVLCLGNTFMTLVDVPAAVDVLCAAANHLTVGGCFVVDDIPHDFWPELTEGNWQTGMSDDESMQLVWEPGDSVFALRMGDQVQPDQWTVLPKDRRFRLWLMGEIALAAMCAGLSAPLRMADAGLLVLRREV